MSKKTITAEEAYKILVKNCGIEVGDTVRVLRRADDYELGWENSWSMGMDDWVDDEFIVTDGDDGGGFTLNHFYRFPFFVLEIVRKKSDIDKDENEVEECIEVTMDEVCRKFGGYVKIIRED
jgi:hypothetical protein